HLISLKRCRLIRFLSAVCMNLQITWCTYCKKKTKVCNVLIMPNEGLSVGILFIFFLRKKMGIQPLTIHLSFIRKLVGKTGFLQAMREKKSKRIYCRNIQICRSRSEEHTSELQSRFDLVCRLLLEKKKI